MSPFCTTDCAVYKHWKLSKTISLQLFSIEKQKDHIIKRDYQKLAWKQWLSNSDLTSRFLILFFWSDIASSENPLRVASFKFGLSLGLNHWVMYYVSFLSWFLAFIFSMCGIWARHIVLRFEPVLFVLCSVIEIIVLICLFSPSSIIAFSHACFKFRSVRVIYWNRR